MGNVCAHNEIYNAPQQAVWFGGNNNIIEYNNIHDVALLSSDSSAVYTGRRWDEVGNIIRYNAIYNIGSDGFTPHGIYFDDGATGQTVYGNLIMNCNGYAFLIGGGRNHSIFNNIIINCDRAFIYDERSRAAVLDPDFWFEHSREGLDMHQNLLASPWQSEVWQTAYPYMKSWSVDYSDTENPGFIANPSDSKINGNLVVSLGKDESEFEGSVSTYSDISLNAFYRISAVKRIFADFENGDYRLRDNSPVFDDIPDFENLPFDEIGRVIRN